VGASGLPRFACLFCSPSAAFITGVTLPCGDPSNAFSKGEALHALRGFLFVANEGKIRRHYDEEQLNQVSCLNLVTNAVVLWNTVYMSAVLDQLRSEGYNVNDGDVVHLSPARYAHINPYAEMPL